MISDADKDRAKKVRMLMLRGATDGERDAAENRLNAMALRLGMSISGLIAEIEGRSTIYGMPRTYIDPNMVKKRKNLRKDYEEFIEEYEASCREFDIDEWVPARLVAMTGIILWELVKVGYAYRIDDAFKPGV